MSSLSDDSRKVALVAGSSTGIGFALARGLATVVVNGHDADTEISHVLRRWRRHCDALKWKQAGPSPVPPVLPS